MVLETQRDVITALGGIQAVADLTGRGYSAVGNWHSGHQKFPANTFKFFVRELEARGLSAPDSLWGML